jgi:hypothetical protein
MYLPKAATPHVFALQNAARRAPSNVASQSQRTAESSLGHIFARKQQRAAPPNTPGRSSSQGEKQALPRPQQADVQHSSTVLYRPNCGEASVYVRCPGLAPAASLRLYRGSGKRFFTGFEFRCCFHPHLAASCLYVVEK